MPRRVRFLDAGAGTGEDCAAAAVELMDLYARREVEAWEVVCVELSQASVDAMHRRFSACGVGPESLLPGGRVRVVTGSYLNETLMADLGTFDIVHSSGSLHHVPDPDEGLLLLRKALAEGGLLYLQLPQPTPF